MLSYSLIIITTTILSYISVKEKNKKIKKIFKILTILFPSVIAGIRYGIGTDYLQVYYPFFEELKQGIIVNRMRNFEVGYVLINRVVILFNGDFNWVMFICSLITNYFIYKGLEEFKDKANLPFGIFLYMLLYYQKSFNLVRQMMAVAISFYCIKYICEGHKIKYAIGILIASLFQRTTLILLIIPIVQKLYENKKYKIIIIASFVVLIVGIFNFKVIGEFLAQSVDLEYYSYYFKATEAKGVAITYFIRILSGVLVYGFIYKLLQQNKNMFLMFNLFFIGAILSLLGYVTSTYGERIAIYFLVYQILVIPYSIRLLDKMNVKYKNYIKLGLTIFILICNIGLWYNDYIYKEREETIPYTTIFNNLKNNRIRY